MSILSSITYVKSPVNRFSLLFLVNFVIWCHILNITKVISNLVRIYLYTVRVVTTTFLKWYYRTE